MNLAGCKAQHTDVLVHKVFLNNQDLHLVVLNNPDKTLNISHVCHLVTVLSPIKQFVALFKFISMLTGIMLQGPSKA